MYHIRDRQRSMNALKELALRQLNWVILEDRGLEYYSMPDDGTVMLEAWNPYRNKDHAILLFDSYTTALLYKTTGGYICTLGNASSLVTRWDKNLCKAITLAATDSLNKEINK